jgi:hypothetical protein
MKSTDYSPLFTVARLIVDCRPSAVDSVDSVDSVDCRLWTVGPSGVL